MPPAATPPPSPAAPCRRRRETPAIARHPHPTRTLLVGDVHGHADQLRRVLAAAGADCDRGELPPGLAVVQLGDLVHRGPHSRDTVALVDRFRAAGAAWWQLAGNHEHAYLGGDPTPRRRDRRSHTDDVDERTAATLRHWHARGWLRAAAALAPTDPGDAADSHAWTLATHAGVTPAYWRDTLARRRHPADAARLLDTLLADDPARLAAGGLVGGRDTRGGAGPLWAHAAAEVADAARRSDDPPPFAQAFGHTSPYQWRRRRWHPWTPHWLRDTADVDHDAGEVRWHVPTRRRPHPHMRCLDASDAGHVAARTLPAAPAAAPDDHPWTG